jgi:hypothetical protein
MIDEQGHEGKDDLSIAWQREKRGASAFELFHDVSSPLFAFVHSLQNWEDVVAQEG